MKIAFGTPLVDDQGRIGKVTALVRDETLFVRTGAWKRRSWVASIVDVSGNRAPLKGLDHSLSENLWFANERILATGVGG